MPSSPALIPELLYEIVAAAVAQYVDDLLAGPWKPTNDESSSKYPSQQDAVLRDIAYNPCIALLQTSYQLRHITLLVLSQSLAIRRDSAGVGRLDQSPMACLHSARCFLWEAKSGVHDAHKRFQQSSFKTSEIIQQYMLLGDIQETTASVLSPSRLYSSKFDYAALELFTLAKQSYIDLLSPEYLSSIPDALGTYPRQRLIAAVVELFSGIPLALNLSLRQLRIIKDCCEFTGELLEDAYEASIRSVAELEYVMVTLYELELNTCSPHLAAPLQILCECSIETCDELCILVSTVDDLEDQHNELQEKARRFRDAMKARLDKTRSRASP